MVESSYFYRFEETLGPHVILSNLFWWTSFILVITAYKNRRIWNVGEMPWAYLFLTFLFFGIRELGHLDKSPVVGSIRYVFGIFSAIFMTSALIFIYIKIYKRKTISKKVGFIPLVFALIFPIFFIYLYFSGTQTENLKNTFFTIENILWIMGGSIMVYTTYMLGTKSTGGFVYVFMFFQLAAFFAILWKFLGFIGSISCPVPYSIREFLETMFGVFAIISMYVLEKMLRNLSKHLL
ncbi:MAG: hypothetical protein OIN83_08370 [Candidatus Methanoperedens sp.]|nr:hypothetical protein [Candidatus Methanoperedens sp.]